MSPFRFQILFFILLFGALVIDDLHMLRGDQGDVVLLRPGYTPLEHHREEYPRYTEDGHQRLVGELDGVVSAVCGVANRFQGSLAHLEQLCSHSGLSVEPEIFRIAVAVIHRESREILGADSVDDGIAVFLLHQDLVEPQNEMGTEFRRNAVEVMIRSIVTVELSGEIPVGSVQLSHPGAFHGLDGIGQYHGACLTGFFLDHTLFQLELALGHFFLGLVTGPGQLDRLLEGGRLIINEIQSTLAVPQNVLGGVGGIAAAQQHGVVVLAGYVVGLNQGIGAEGRGTILTKGGDDDSRHGKKQRRLIEIVHDAKILEAAQNDILLFTGMS